MPAGRPATPTSRGPRGPSRRDTQGARSPDPDRPLAEKDGNPGRLVRTCVLEDERAPGGAGLAQWRLPVPRVGSPLHPRWDPWLPPVPSFQHRPRKTRGLAREAPEGPGPPVHAPGPGSRDVGASTPNGISAHEPAAVVAAPQATRRKPVHAVVRIGTAKPLDRPRGKHSSPGVSGQPKPQDAEPRVDQERNTKQKESSHPAECEP